MLGKYSPTVHHAYYVDQDWFEKYAGDELYDPEGYDSYGYDKDGTDRVGYEDLDYARVCECCGQTVGLYYDIKDMWTFDGTKPVEKII